MDKQLVWLSGLLEGEGCFGSTVRKARGLKNSRYTEIKIQLRMCDEDVVRHAAEIMGCNVHRYEHNPSKQKWKPYYSAILQGNKAADMMNKLFPFMGLRRSEAIKKALKMWNERRTISDSVKEQFSNGMSQKHKDAISRGTVGKRKSREHAIKIGLGLSRYWESRRKA